jgi:MFS family permease
MTVVNVALPSIGRDLGLGIAGLQWILDGFLLTLGALMLLGGALGDAYGRRRVFVAGAVAFALASAFAALAPNLAWLVTARLLQGAAGALLVPNSLALLESSMREADRGRAVGQWAGWSGATTALGPLLGGWLVDTGSWRWIFAAVAPFALAAALVAARALRDGERDRTPDIDRGKILPASGRHPASGARAPSPRARGVDYLGAALVTLGLGGVIGALIAGPGSGFTSGPVLAAGTLGGLLLVAFAWQQQRARDPLIPYSLFRSRTFTGANATTLFVYAALGGLFFLLMVQLQNGLGWSALRAGAALLPINALMVALSPSAGALARRVGARWPIALGASAAGAGALLFARVVPGASYLNALLPALLVFGLGLTAIVAPLTAAVLASAPAARKAVASAINNAIARLAMLIATAALPVLAGMGGLERLEGPALERGFVRAMWITAALCFVGAVVAFLTVRREDHR